MTAPKSTPLFPQPIPRISVQSGRGLFREGVSELFRQHGFEARGFATQADLLDATRRGLAEVIREPLLSHRLKTGVTDLDGLLTGAPARNGEPR